MTTGKLLLNLPTTITTTDIATTTTDIAKTRIGITDTNAGRQGKIGLPGASAYRGSGPAACAAEPEGLHSRKTKGSPLRLRGADGPFLTRQHASLRAERFLPQPDRRGVILSLGPTLEPTRKLISFQIV